MDVIRECIERPYFVKDYELETCTLDGQKTADVRSIAHESAFTGFSASNRGGAGTEGHTTTMDQRLRQLYMRVWTGFGRFLVRETRKGRCVLSLEVGYFYPDKDNAQDSSTVARRCRYSPTIELLERHKYTLHEDQYNVPPGARDVRVVD